jgi:hypothetical protein
VRPWDATIQGRGDGSNFDIGADEFVGPVRFDFASSEESWASGTADVFSPPQWIYEPGRIMMFSGNNSDTFGFWRSVSNAVPVTQGYLYRARFVVSTNVTEQWLVPTIRLRVNANNLLQADYLQIDSAGDGSASPTSIGTTYDLYFLPSGYVGFCMLAFDLLNFDAEDAPDAEVALESVVVERFALAALGTPTTISTHDFETSQESWSFADGRAILTDPEFFWEAGALHLLSTTNTNTFGYWHSDATDITVEADRLYRGTFEVRTDVTDRSRVPQMRLRFNTENMQVSRTLSIKSVGDGANSPGTSNTLYDMLYFMPPANCVGGGLIVSFDMLNFSPEDAAEGSLILDRAVVESLPIPISP